MIGGIGKMRPCGHHHYYKYAHAKDYKDVKEIIPNYRQDIEPDGTWEFPFENLKSTGYYQSSLFYRWLELKNWDDKAPNCTLNSHPFSNSVNLTKFNFTWKGAGAHAVPGIHLNTSIKREFNLKYPNATDISYGLSNICCGEDSIFRIFAPKAKNAESLLNGNYINDSSKIIIEFDTEKITNANSFLNTGKYLPFTDELKYPIDEDGEHTFVSGKEQVGFSYSLFPNLSTGNKMFSGCGLTKEYTIAFLNSIPDWSNDTAEHNLTIGICADYGYDSDLNLLLKSIDKNYITPIEKIGQSLPEEVTIDKGWNLTVEWNHATSDEPLHEHIKEKLEFDTIVLPDGYTRCEYLEDTGTQWINTNYIPISSTGLYIIAKNITKGDHVPMGGGMKNAKTAFHAPRWIKNGSSDFFWKTQYNLTSYGSGSIYEGWMNYKNDKIAKLFTQGNEYIKELDDFGEERTVSLHLFDASHGSNYKGTSWKGRIYRAQITEGDNIIRDFIPCLDADGVPCMYDIIEPKAYYNESTTSTFLYKIAEL